MERLLDQLEDQKLLWSEHGLRSLARTDQFYRKRNAPFDEPYWRGPIWINVNFLALGALYHYKSSVTSVGLLKRVEGLYGRLRTNVLRTVLNEFDRTGHFWEQYDDVSGGGLRGHPFTGWTALVVNIMAEKY